MRRSALKLLVAGGLAFTTLPSMAGAPRKADKRLLGTWRSDKERTYKLWRFRTEVTPETKARYESMFGKLTLRFTTTHQYSEYEGDKNSVPYSVFAFDSRSVVIGSSFENPVTRESEFSLQQIFFEEDGYYVATGYNFEFFRRVNA